MRTQTFSTTSSQQAGFNDSIARLYRTAWEKCSLEATIQVMSELIEGELHLAFLTSGDGKIAFDTSRGREGIDFLMATMSAAKSHPLIYQRDGEINAISDALSAHNWQRREMYQRSRPFVKMGDSLGLDLCITPEMTFSTCVIRDRRGFRDHERSGFHLMIPHFLNVLGMNRNRSPRNRHFQLLPLSSLPSTRQALYRQLHARLKPDITVNDRLIDWIHSQREAAPVTSRFLTSDSYKATFIPRGQRCEAAVAIQPIPKSPPPMATSASTMHPSLTRRENEVSHWLCAGKTNLEIAIILSISPGTVKRHLENIYEKLHVPNRVSAVALLQESSRSCAPV